MSRIGKLPVSIPEGVEIKITEENIICKGPKGELKLDLDPSVKIEQKDSEIVVSLEDNTRKAMWGTYRQLIFNLIEGVTKGFEKKLEVVGVGYKAQAQGKKIVITVGYTNPVEMEAPEGIEFKVEKNIIAISGIDKQQVGQTAAEIRQVKTPEPYKGKGIRYVGEHVRKKEGKKAATSEE
ncbi:MAG: 50S ribosomal protein L6 [Parcubacteria group bacterium]|nr:50S ribosomal protein L6 [Parcubacteria group bacterium]